MDKIQECAMCFQHLVNTTSYIFHAVNRRVHVIRLDFKASDFYHLTGLQYLTDIDIPKNKKNTISWILDKRRPVTDDYLAKSAFYKGKPDDEKDIENRIANLRFLEQYLDEDNMIRMYSPKDGPPNSSLIKCDYIIESQLQKSHTIVYIFLKHRHGTGANEP
ncbi:MAG: PBECR4 domain-containing protein [Blautia sp.]|nr:PBECR4 domain-containing protein [Blautia sp.]